jgi:hypothetical protein
MSEFDQDPSASTGRFRAFVEQVDEEAYRRGRRVPPALIIGVVAVVAIIIVIVAVG